MCKEFPETLRFHQILQLCGISCLSRAKMAQRTLTLAEKVGFLEQIKQQPPNPSQRKLLA